MPPPWCCSNAGTGLTIRVMKAPALLLCVFLLGCAAKAPVWDKPGATQEQFDADKRFCEFEVLKASQGTDPTLKTVVGQELDRSMRRRDLALSCMRMKGYTQR